MPASSQHAPGVALGEYRAIGADVLLSCLDCCAHRRVPRERVIERLQARGLGDEHTGIKAVAGFVRAPCPKCGGSRFDARPAFPNFSGQ